MPKKKSDKASKKSSLEEDDNAAVPAKEAEEEVVEKEKEADAGRNQEEEKQEEKQEEEEEEAVGEAKKAAKKHKKHKKHATEQQQHEQQQQEQQQDDVPAESDGVGALAAKMEQLELISDEEKEAFEKFKAEYRTVVDEELPDKLLLRIVRSRKYDVKRSKALCQNYVKWYNSIGVKRLRIDHVRRVMQEYIMAAPGALDKDGYQIVYMRPNHYFPEVIPREELIRAVVYTMECAIEDTKTEIEGFTFMCAMKNFGWQNFETQYAQNFMQTMENRFPARLRKFILVDPPGWFNLIWALIRPMMGAKFASKWNFVSSEKLRDIVSDENIVSDLGGSHPHDQMGWIKRRYEIEGIPWTEEVLVPELKGSMIVEKDAK